MGEQLGTRRYGDERTESTAQIIEEELKRRRWKDPAVGYRAYLDVEAAIDFHVLEVLSGNVDAMVLSTYFQKTRSGKIVCGPHWDFDRALGSTDQRDADPRGRIRPRQCRSDADTARFRALRWRGDSEEAAGR